MERRFTSGERVLHYEVLDELGVGGMGIAYRAFDSRLHRTVALKTIRPDMTAAPDQTRRLLREARAAAALSHPNICMVYAVEETPDAYFIAMEYVNGQTLAKVAANGRVSADRATSLAIQATDALSAAHRVGIIHRDIKPSNIMLTHDGQIKILDFGLARRVVEAEALLSHTTAGVARTGEIVGTVPYMSPEQIEARPLDGRTDLFSLGVVLYELCAGRHPFLGPTQLATAVRVLTADVSPLGQVIDGFPGHFDRIVQRCLRKDREQRYATADELIADLRHGHASPLWRPRDVASKPSVAVLPFVEAGVDESDAYFSDGISSEIIARLAQAGDVLVISRTSSMRFRSTTKDVREIGRELGVKALVEGYIRRSGTRCTLSVQLISAEDGFHIWSDRYEVPTDEIFNVQELVARQIARALRVEGPETGREPRTPPTDSKAFEAYLRALHAYHKFSNADNLVAIELLTGALAQAPSFARAHALLANAYLARVERRWEDDGRRWIGLAIGSATRALQLDSTISEAYSARALIALVQRRSGDAEADVREALRADANNDIAHNLLGRIRFARGDFLGAIASYQSALRINPYYVWCLNDLAWTFWLVGDHDSAYSTLQRVLAISPMDEGGRSGMAGIHLLEGRLHDALRDIRLAQQSNPQYPFVFILLPLILARTGSPADAVALCEQILVQDSDSYFGHASLGLVHAHAGDRQGVARSAARALSVVPIYPALNLTYAVLYSAMGEHDWAVQWLRKGVREGIRTIEIEHWHPLLHSLIDNQAHQLHEETQ